VSNKRDGRVGDCGNYFVAGRGPFIKRLASGLLEFHRRQETRRAKSRERWSNSMPARHGVDYLRDCIFGEGRADWLPASDDDMEGQEQTLAAAKACRFGQI